MSQIRVLQYLAFIILSAVSASPFTGAENPPIIISPTSNVSQTPASIPLFTPSNITTSNALDIKCDGAQYGDNLDLADCKDAKSYIASGSVPRPWVERQTYFHTPHYVLPYRYMGGTCRDI